VDDIDKYHIKNSELDSEGCSCVPSIVVGDPNAEYVNVSILFLRQKN
jgi:hypothetical protein